MSLEDVSRTRSGSDRLDDGVGSAQEACWRVDPDGAVRQVWVDGWLVHVAPSGERPRCERCCAAPPGMVAVDRSAGVVTRSGGRVTVAVGAWLVRLGDGQPQVDVKPPTRGLPRGLLRP